MTWLTHQITSGFAIELIVVLMVVEGLALAWWHGRTGQGPGLTDFAATLVSGLCLMMALRAGLVGDGPLWIGFWLVVALIAHLTDLLRRWRT
ncbi:hypothetical protein [Magnetospirillum fulvum]|uniref:DUF2568 domain-containing protein n=1 Tax=Magnetospirillum fulvum TaxID=1082 RepID=A0A1H6HJU6_MAGFU|nr:hypothetical protein [Magnetospirillum fulvum]SEH35736.1 hypothetical protein SAMN04244559_01837 [Magnetospirillum fulvum]